MRTTIDKAGRVVVPKELRDALGITPGEVELTIQGTRIVLEQPTSRLREEDGHLLLPLGGPALTDDQIRDLRFADQR